MPEKVPDGVGGFADPAIAAEFQEPVSCEQLMDEYEGARRELDELRARGKRAQERHDALEIQLVESLKQTGNKSVKRQTGVMFTLVERNFFRVDQDNRPAQRQYLEEIGREDLLSVNYQAWQGHCKELVESGQPVPPFSVKTTEIGLSVRGLR